MANILVVDDSTSIRQLAAFTLKSKGHVCEEAVDGEDALTKAGTAQYDLVITDLNMPNKNGLQLSIDLRSMAQYKFTPILMLTTESDGSKKQEGKDAGITGWIIKPFNPDALLKVVGKVLGD